MSNIKNFDFNSYNVRALNESGEIYFVAKDVADVLGYSDASKMVENLDDDEISNRILGGFNKNGKAICLTESGLYSCILTSRKPIAKEFKRWVTHEVLPSIRKSGQYGQCSVEAKPSFFTIKEIYNAFGYLCKWEKLVAVSKELSLPIVKVNDPVQCRYINAYHARAFEAGYNFEVVRDDEGKVSVSKIKRIKH